MARVVVAGVIAVGRVSVWAGRWVVVVRLCAAIAYVLRAPMMVLNREASDVGWPVPIDQFLLKVHSRCDL